MQNLSYQSARLLASHILSSSLMSDTYRPDPIVRQFVRDGHLGERDATRPPLSVADYVAEALFAELPQLRDALKVRQIASGAIGRAVAIHLKACERGGERLTPLGQRLMAVWKKAAGEQQGGFRG